MKVWQIMNAPVKPTLQALLIADQIYRDAVTAKHVVAGIFDEIRVLKPPPQESVGQASLSHGNFTVGSPFAYLSLRDVRGEQAFVLRYVSLSDESVLFECSFTARTSDPLELVQLALALPPLRQDVPGTFALELLWNDQPLGSYRVRVIHFAVPDQETPNAND